MDWFLDFEEKFKDDEDVKNLREEQFCGNIQINFFKGTVVDINKYETIKPK